MHWYGALASSSQDEEYISMKIVVQIREPSEGKSATIAKTLSPNLELAGCNGNVVGTRRLREIKDGVAADWLTLVDLEAEGECDAIPACVEDFRQIVRAGIKQVHAEAKFEIFFVASGDESPGGPKEG
jgi:hypothetical protein